VAESSAIPGLPGLVLETVEWLPSGADSGLVRVRCRWEPGTAPEPDLPALALRVEGTEHRFESLPDARFSRDPDSWRGTYLVAAELVATDPEALWVEWPSGARAGLPRLSRGAEPLGVPAAPERPEEPDEPGGQVIAHAVLAERRARRAEAAEQAQARAAAEALKAVEVLELRSVELERRLEEATAERDALAAREPGARSEALTAALAAAAEVRGRAREWQLRLRTSEIVRAGDAVRLAVLESERAGAASAADARATGLATELAAARAAADEARARSEADLAAADEARTRSEAEIAAASERVETAEARAHGESVARATLEDELDRARAAYAERDALRADLDAATAEAADLRDRLAAAEAAHVHAADVAAELDGARGEASDLRFALEAARGEASDLRSGLEAARAEAAELRGRLEHADLATADLNHRLQEDQADRAALREQLEAATASRESLGAELERARHERDEARAEAERLRVEGDEARAEAERLRVEGDEARAEAERLRVEGDAARAGVAELERLAREQAEAAAAREPADASRLVADLDAAAEALRSRTPVSELPPEQPEPVAPDAELVAAPWRYADGSQAPEPAAPDAEPASEWDARDEPRRDPVAPGVEPVRAVEQRDAAPAWQRPGVEPVAHEDVDDDEPPAPDAEPAVEWAIPARGPDQPAPFAAVGRPEEVAASPEQAVATTEQVVAAPEEVIAAPEPAVAAPEPAPAGPRIVPAARPPARGLMVGSTRRDYPLLRGAIVKLAHDDPALAGRVLAALLPAQGLAVKGPLSYDLSIGGVGMFSVSVTAGRTFVRTIEEPRSRAEADFHLRAAPLVLAELLAGVEHRMGRFFGPARIRGRKRRAKALRVLPGATATLAEAARAGAQLEPELVYRTLAYAVHPSWTRGHRFTIAQVIDGEPSETWYLTADDGAGLSVAPTARGRTPDASVSMTRDVFDRLVRAEPVASGERPIIRGDREAVAHMTAWTRRAQA
jgi:hypothetical protein